MNKGFERISLPKRRFLDSNPQIRPNRFPLKILILNTKLVFYWTTLKLCIGSAYYWTYSQLVVTELQLMTICFRKLKDPVQLMLYSAGQMDSSISSWDQTTTATTRTVMK